MAGCGLDQKGLHWMAARMAFGPGATKEDRYNSKRIIFSKMFGGGPASGAKQVGVPVSSAAAVHDAFEAIAPGFTAWDQQMRAYVKAGNRAFRAYSGRTIWLPPPHRPHAAGNYAIQGTARELLVDGCLRWGQTRWGRLPLLPIHDEIFTFVPAAEVAEAQASLMACMRNQRFTEIYGVPIEAAASAPFTAWPDSS
jgi:DNA polymerase-1